MFARSFLSLVLTGNLFFLSLGPCVSADPEIAQLHAAAGWFKGHTHAHTWRSDGDDSPVAVADWYAEHGYQFLTISDHNLLTLATGRLLLIPGEEISDSAQGLPVHLTALNISELVRPRGGPTVFDAMRNNVNAVLAQSARAGRPMLAILNHPNFHWACTADDLMRVAGPCLIEVFNGHPDVNTYGDAEHPSAERMWDIILTRRLTDLQLPVMYAVAADDTHHIDPRPGATPGRGWVMVRAARLDAEEIVAAMQGGDFYATTGILLDDLRFQDNTLEIFIQARPDVSYRTQFIGTLFNYQDEAAAPDEANSEIGKVLAEQSGSYAVYHMTGQEIYVRAKVISTAAPENPPSDGDFETAWIQPVLRSAPAGG